MYIIAILIAFYFCKKKAPLIGISQNSVENCIIITFLGAILGARLYYVLLSLDFYSQNPFEFIAIWHGGLAIHGGLIGGTICGYLYCKYKKISVLKLGDLMLPFLLLGQSIGRLGNFANGEAHGVPTFIPWSIIFSIKNKFPDFWANILSTFNIENTPLGLSKLYSLLKEGKGLDVIFEGKNYKLFEYIPWGISFPEKFNSAAYQQFGSLPVHPTFFYEMFLDLLGAIILLLLWKNNKNIGKGLIIGLYMIFYAVIRSFVTFFRADDLMIGFLRAPHLVSLIMIIIGFFMCLYYKKVSKRGV